MDAPLPNPPEKVSFMGWLILAFIICTIIGLISMTVDWVQSWGDEESVEIIDHDAYFTCLDLNPHSSNSIEADLWDETCKERNS